MPDVEGRIAALARIETEAILREQLIIALNTNTARGIDRLRVGVGTDQTEAPSVTSRHLDARGVVVSDTAIVHQLDDGEIRERLASDQRSRTGRRLIGVLEAVQMTAGRAQKAALDDEVAAEL